MSEPSPRSSLVRWLYTHNPFYAISAALMLYAVRAGYGELEIGSINCWVMMGILAAYTLLLAGVGVCIVRLGRVWEDARPILLLLLLLFLAVSIRADDLFVKATSPEQGIALLVCGFLFAVAVSAGAFWGLRIRIGWQYAVPFVFVSDIVFRDAVVVLARTESPPNSLDELERVFLSAVGSDSESHTVAGGEAGRKGSCEQWHTVALAVVSLVSVWRHCRSRWDSVVRAGYDFRTNRADLKRH